MRSTSGRTSRCKPLSPPPSSFSSTSRGSGTDILVYGRLLLRGAGPPCPDLQRHEQSIQRLATGEPCRPPVHAPGKGTGGRISIVIFLHLVKYGIKEEPSFSCLWWGGSRMAELPRQQGRRARKGPAEPAADPLTSPATAAKEGPLEPISCSAAFPIARIGASSGGLSALTHFVQ